MWITDYPTVKKQFCSFEMGKEISLGGLMLLSLVFSAVLVNDSRVHSFQDYPVFKWQLI